MAYDEGLAERIRELTRESGPLDERKMFGGIAFMIQGHMAIGIVDDTLMVRVGPTAYAAALKRRHVRPMDFTGKPLTGYVYVDPPGIAEDADLAAWLAVGRDFAASLPPKPPKLPKSPKSPKPAKPGVK